MSEPPTKLTSYQTYEFLSERLQGLSTSLLEKPDEAAIWVGAGVSKKVSGLPTWAEFLRSALELLPGANAPVLENELAASSPHELVEILLKTKRYALAAQVLEEALQKKLSMHIQHVFSSENSVLPCLPSLCVGDVLTTNYDALLENSLKWHRKLSPTDPISTLLEPGLRLIKLHGTATEPESCVLSTASYAKAYTNDFRWYLTTMFRQKSFVFLGASMHEAEPFFEAIRLGNQLGKESNRHFAVVSVRSSAEANALGKKLKKYSIELLPYIPDAHHSFLDELFAHLEGRRRAPEVVSARLELASLRTREGRMAEATAILWHLLDVQIEKRPLQRRFGDVLTDFLEICLDGGDSLAASRLSEWSDSGADAIDMCLRAADLIDPMSKAVDRLNRVAERIQSLSNRKSKSLEVKLSTLKGRRDERRNRN